MARIFYRLQATRGYNWTRFQVQSVHVFQVPWFLSIIFFKITRSVFHVTIHPEDYAPLPGSASDVFKLCFLFLFLCLCLFVDFFLFFSFLFFLWIQRCIEIFVQPNRLTIKRSFIAYVMVFSLFSSKINSSIYSNRDGGICDADLEMCFSDCLVHMYMYI